MDGEMFFTTLLKIPRPKPGEEKLQQVLVIAEQRSKWNIQAGLGGAGLAKVLGCDECKLVDQRYKIPVIFDVRKRCIGTRLITTFRCAFADGLSPKDENAPPCLRKNRVK